MFSPVGVKIVTKMAGLLQQWMDQYDAAYPQADPRTRHWLLVWDSPWPMWTLTVTYIFFCIAGPRLMRDHKPFKLQEFLVVYNLGLALLSLYMCVELSLAVWDADYDLICAPFTKDSFKNPKELRVARVLWWYYFSKAIELMDTVCMVARKKFNQISFLHVFHHASMLNIWWWSMMFIPGGMSWFGPVMNSLVHVVMYTYYGLSAIPSLRDKLWWKRYITRFQLIQFVIVFAHTVNSVRVGCEFPAWGQWVLSSYMLILFSLFINFYIKAYLSRPSATKTNIDTIQTSRPSHQNGPIKTDETCTSLQDTYNKKHD